MLAGGETATGSSLTVFMASFDPDGSGAIRTAEPILSPIPGGDGELLDLEDGSYLFIPRDETASLQWFGLLPRFLAVIERPPTARDGVLRGIVMKPGTAVLSSDGGELFAFHSGPNGLSNQVSPAFASRESGLPSGLVPSNSLASSLADGVLTIRGPELFGLDFLPEERVMITQRDVMDFELVLSFALLEPEARPSVLFGASDGDFDQLILDTAPRVTRSPVRRSGARIACEPVSLPALSASGPHRVRVRRSGEGRRLALDLGADGTEELRCETPVPRSGTIALGVVNGRVAFWDPILRFR
ncbi:MAG: hypothetical protein HC923_05570 [Myxococcales bacterium]|nr:hypothetical protein [Myxococcales bacterium]